MALTTEDRVYIDHIFGAYREVIRDDIQKVLEAVNARPTEERVREIFHEEMRPIRQETQIFKEEMIALRKDSNRRDREIKALKLKRA